MCTQIYFLFHDSSDNECHSLVRENIEEATAGIGIWRDYKDTDHDGKLADTVVILIVDLVIWVHTNHEHTKTQKTWSLANYKSFSKLCILF